MNLSAAKQKELQDFAKVVSNAGVLTPDRERVFAGLIGLSVEQLRHLIQEDTRKGQPVELDANSVGVRWVRESDLQEMGWATPPRRLEQEVARRARQTLDMLVALARARASWRRITPALVVLLQEAMDTANTTLLERIVSLVHDASTRPRLPMDVNRLLGVMSVPRRTCPSPQARTRLTQTPSGPTVLGVLEMPRPSDQLLDSNAQHADTLEEVSPKPTLSPEEALRFKQSELLTSLGHKLSLVRRLLIALKPTQPDAHADLALGTKAPEAPMAPDELLASSGVMQIVQATTSLEPSSLDQVEPKLSLLRRLLPALRPAHPDTHADLAPGTKAPEAQMAPEEQAALTAGEAAAPSAEFPSCAAAEPPGAPVASEWLSLQAASEVFEQEQSPSPDAVANATTDTSDAQSAQSSPLQLAVALVEAVARNYEMRKVIAKQTDLLDNRYTGAAPDDDSGRATEEVLVLLLGAWMETQPELAIPLSRLEQVLWEICRFSDWRALMLEWFTRAVLKPGSTGTLLAWKSIVEMELDLAWQCIAQFALRMRQPTQTSPAPSRPSSPQQSCGSTEMLPVLKASQPAALASILERAVAAIGRLINRVFVVQPEGSSSSAALSHREAAADVALLFGMNSDDADRETVRLAASICQHGKLSFDDCLRIVNARSLFHYFYGHSRSQSRTRLVVLHRPPGGAFISRIEQPLSGGFKDQFERADLERQLHILAGLARAAQKIWAQPVAPEKTLFIEAQLPDYFTRPTETEPSQPYLSLPLT